MSLASLVGTQTNCNVLIPQFEVDQYFKGDAERAIQIYKERYPTAVSNNFIKSYTVNPNNLELSEGAQSTVNNSFGFGFLPACDHYGIFNKFNNISLYRIDSFYITLFNSFMYKYEQTFSYTNYISVYVNLPNIINLGDANGFNSGSKVKSVFINSPKAQDIDIHFLIWNTTITDLYMNTPNITEITGTNLLARTNKGETTGIYLHSLTTSDINRLYTLIYNKRASDATNLYKDTTCTYTDFDVRYWSEEQNESGSDR